MRLAMSILVRDEADIIEENIRYHADQGVDLFIVMDNDSRDGTRDILQRMKTELEILLLDEPSKKIDQGIWVTRMVAEIRDKSLADWIVLNDADEFWVSSRGSLKSEIMDIANSSDHTPLERAATVIRCPRYNMLAEVHDLERENYRFFHNVWKVANPLGDWPRSGNAPADIPHLLQRVGPKAISEVKGFHSVDQGNHVVEHCDGSTVDSRTIEILHYPIRTFDQFERKVRNYATSLQANERLRDKVEVSHHFRRWYALLEEGKLHDEFDTCVLTKQRIEDLTGRQIISRDDRLRDYFQLKERHRSIDATSGIQKRPA